MFIIRNKIQFSKAFNLYSLCTAKKNLQICCHYTQNKLNLMILTKLNPANQSFCSIPLKRSITKSTKDDIFCASVMNKKNEFENPYEDMLKKRKRAITEPSILLIETDNSIISLTLGRAEKLALKRNLKLVRVEDPTKISKGGRLVYKLLTSADYRQEMNLMKEKKKKSEEKGFKGEKLLNVSDNIDLRDLNVKIKKVVEWLSKNYQVTLTIACKKETSNYEADIIEQLEKAIEVCQGRIIQKVVTETFVRCVLNPPKKTASNKSVDKNSNLEEKS